MNRVWKSDACEPVFVVGMNGSGTSMMIDSLGMHPNLYALPDETHMLPYVIDRASKYGDLRNDQNYLRYWQFVIDNIPVLVRFNGGKRPEIPDDWRERPRTAAGVIDGLFGGLASASGKSRWCEKTPDYVQHISTFSEVFPRAKFIHMIRDGREVCYSVSRRQYRTPELLIFRWKKLVRLGRRAGSHIHNRYLEVKYETLTGDPEETMREVCEFLGVPFDSRILRSKMRQNPNRKRLRDGALGSIVENPQKWPEVFDRETVSRLEGIAGCLLDELGYEVATKPGDRDPGRVVRTWWRFGDFVRLTLRRRKSRKYLASWTGVVRHVLMSFRAYRTKRY